MRAEDVEYLVVHTAAYPHRNCDRDVIDRWHRERGWSGIGYHFVVLNDLHDELADGTVQEGRTVSRRGAHVLGINGRSLGICCVGHGDKQPHTEAQRAGLLQLLSDLMDEHPAVTVDGVIGHREVNGLAAQGVVATRFKTGKSCPGSKVDMDEIRRELRELRSGGPSVGELPGEGEASEAEVREALEVLAAAPGGLFPNAVDELRDFLSHPEVRAMRAEE